MKIAYVGNFKQRHCTEVHLAATLGDLGHEVTELQEPDGYDKDFDDTLMDRVEGHDLFLFTRTWGKSVTLNHLREMRELNIPSVSYHLDLYVGLNRGNDLENDPFWRTDYVFTPDGDPESLKVFESKGINHFYMKPGVYKNECYIAESLLTHPNRDNKGNDVVFVGGGAPTGEPEQYGHSEWPYRGELLKFLRDTYGDRYSKYGYPQDTVRNEELNLLYARSKIVVGDSLCLNFDHPYYWSDRAYETIGRGGFLIHPYIKGMEEEFTDGETIVFYEYNKWDELKEKIDYYLKHDKEREKIRLAGHEFVKQHATYNNRLQQMLDVVRATGAVPTPSPVASTTPKEPVKINLGAGSEPTEGWVNVDWIAQKGIDVVHNLLKFPWPFDSGVADEMLARDVLEHMPLYNQQDESVPIKFVEECHRILQPGGKLFMTMPHWESPNMWIDPTHVRGYDEQSFDYFDPETDLGKAYGYYSDKKFQVSAIRTPNDNVEFTLIKL